MIAKNNIIADGYNTNFEQNLPFIDFSFTKQLGDHFLQISIALTLSWVLIIAFADFDYAKKYFSTHCITIIEILDKTKFSIDTD